MGRKRQEKGEGKEGEGLGKGRGWKLHWCRPVCILRVSNKRPPRGSCERYGVPRHPVDKGKDRERGEWNLGETVCVIGFRGIDAPA